MAPVEYEVFPVRINVHLVMLFNIMKNEVSETIKKYAADSPPPPAQVFTTKHAPGEGNLHYVQKVFKSAFEVWCCQKTPRRWAVAYIS